MKKIPEKGFNLQDICGLAGYYAVYIHIGVADVDIARTPPTITLQVSSKLVPQPMAFSMAIDPQNPMMNKALSVALLEYVQKITPKRLRLNTGLN